MAEKGEWLIAVSAVQNHRFVRPMGWLAEPWPAPPRWRLLKPTTEAAMFPKRTVLAAVVILFGG